MRLFTFAGMLFVACCANADERIVPVQNDAALRAALSAARPGDRIQLAPGDYQPGVYVGGLHGTADQPIVIEAADPNQPPVFSGGSQGLHVSDCSYLTLRHLTIANQRINGINVDDGGSFETPSHHMTLENLRVYDIGPDGNLDGIKMSGVEDFVVRGCHVRGWGGQAVDMVGCHRGVIERCLFEGKDGYTQHTGPQTKGGSSDVVIRRCLFRHAGQRAVNIGGSTGMDYFRPQGAKYEAKDITVEGCIFVGGMAPIAYVGVDGATVRYNTIVRPDKWVIRILQETTEPGFPACRNGRFERNLIVYRPADVSIFVNIGPNTDPASFQFAENLWYGEGATRTIPPDLPTKEVDGVYGVDPRLEDPANDRFKPTNPQAEKYGAWAWQEN